MKRLCYAFLILLLAAISAYAAHDPCNHIVINEVKTVGPNSHMDEFVELFNVTNENFDISGYHLIYFWGDGTTNDTPLTQLSDGRYYRVLYTFPHNTYIAPYHYYLLTSPECSDEKVADAIMDHNIFSIGQLLLVDSTLTDTLDAVAWGDCDSVITNEGVPVDYIEPHTGPPVSPVIDPLPVWSIQRLPEGTDTNDNFADFETRNFCTPCNSDDEIMLLLDHSFEYYKPETDKLMFLWKTLTRTKELNYNLQSKKLDDVYWTNLTHKFAVAFETRLDTNYFKLILNEFDAANSCQFRIEETDFTEGKRYSRVVTMDANEETPIGDESGSEKPDGFYLYPNYPNPFNTKTIVRYQLIEDEQITIYVYNIYGQRIINLYTGLKEKGTHYVGWNGENEYGHAVSTGDYFCVLKTASGETRIQKMLYLK